MGKLDLLYPYQVKAVELSEKNDNGIFCYPTGTGKTFIQSAIVVKDIVNRNSKFGIYVVNCPRILLSYQLLKEVFSFMNSEEIEARYMYLHSGSEGDQKDLDAIREEYSNDNFFSKYSEIPSSTKTGDIYDMIQTAKKQDKPLIIFSTYHSADRVKSALVDETIRIVLNDESHYLVQNQFHDLIHILESERKYFFTATMINTMSENGMGMNNVEKFGKVIDKMLPIEAIKMGKMLRPRLHYVLTDKVYTPEDLENSIGSVIVESLSQHEYVLGKVNPKMMVTVDGTETMKRFKESEEYKTLRRKGVNIYMVSSNEEIMSDINGVKVKRNDFITQLKKDGEDETKRMVVLHYDILTEGIDVPGLTGVMLLRGLNKSKFLQTYGRVARLNKEDRDNIANGTLDIEDIDSYNKPYGWLIIPGIIKEDEDHKAEFSELIDELRSYNFNPVEDIIVTNQGNGLFADEGIEAMKKQKASLGNLGDIVEDVMVEYEEREKADLRKIEEDRISKMTPLERYRHFKENGITLA